MQLFMCECDKRKQSFLDRTNYRCRTLFDNACGLTKPMLPNILNANIRTVVPWPFLVLAGFVCSDKTLMSVNSADMKRSMQDGIGQTAETFELLLAFILLVFNF